MLQRDVARSDGRRFRRVERAGAFGRGAREIERHRLAFDRHVERDADRRVVIAVIVEVVLGAVDAVGQARDLLAHHLRRPGLQLDEGVRDRGLAHLVEQRVQPPRAGAQRVELALQVAMRHGRKPRVGHHHVDDVVVDDAAPRELDDGEMEALLRELGGARIVVAGHVAGHVEPMRDGGEPAEDASLAEDRLHQLHVVDVRAAVIGIVHHVDVARAEIGVARDLRDDRAHGEGHRADEHRETVLALHERLAGRRVVEAVGAVMRLGDDRVEGAAHERRVHLRRDLFEAALEDGEGGGIEAHEAALGSRITVRDRPVAVADRARSPRRRLPCARRRSPAHRRGSRSRASGRRSARRGAPPGRRR